MEQQVRRAAHAAPGGGFTKIFRRTRRRGRRVHAVAGRQRSGRTVTVVAVLAVVGALLVIAPIAPASAAEASATAVAVPMTEVPGHEGWFDGVSAAAEQVWFDVLAFVDHVVAQVEVQLAAVGRSATNLWGRLG